MTRFGLVGFTSSETSVVQLGEDAVQRRLARSSRIEDIKIRGVGLLVDTAEMSLLLWSMKWVSSLLSSSRYFSSFMDWRMPPSLEAFCLNQVNGVSKAQDLTTYQFHPEGAKQGKGRPSSASRRIFLSPIRSTDGVTLSPLGSAPWAGISRPDIQCLPWIAHVPPDHAASVGIGPNRLIAKLASEAQKPDGLTLVPAEQIGDFLAPMPFTVLRG